MSMRLSITAVMLSVIACHASAGGKSATSEDFRKAQDDYYANDLDAAINEARERTHHYDYSSEFRYERTTSQSIRFSRMLNNELEQQRIETASLAPTSAGNTPETGQIDAADSTQDDTPAVDFISQNEKLPSVAPINAAPASAVTLPSSGISVRVNQR
ncbi:MAG: hypothetical protein C9355_14660 [Thalassolituus maritimus]|uniref:Secreted protein n=1 Tax=Thalassolituus maritimus TaxID=484498 RepID=A0A1N7MED6_9GAMM|nr:hypothetical protein [Thalassolituus maritimus]TPD50086.1 MAG: hypothetical protein C9355_14660 [Thalassolituus maritimus]SIS84545.1 hypothetical protein SAMN05421686_105136 [Thalassolituus maritimus]